MRQSKWEQLCAIFYKSVVFMIIAAMTYVEYQRRHRGRDSRVVQWSTYHRDSIAAIECSLFWCLIFFSCKWHIEEIFLWIAHPYVINNWTNLWNDKSFSVNTNHRENVLHKSANVRNWFKKSHWIWFFQQFLLQNTYLLFLMN